MRGLHARSWKYDPNPLLVSCFPPPLPKPLLAVWKCPSSCSCGSCNGSFSPEIPVSKGQVLASCDSCRLALFPRLEITAYDTGAERAMGEGGREVSGFLSVL